MGWVTMSKKILTQKTDDITIGSFSGENGKFDWDLYKGVQQKTSYRKIDNKGPSISRLTLLANHIKENIKNIKFGICHGTRNGVEQKHLRELLNIDVIGTEIADGSGKFDYQIQWDFHDVKDEWVNNVNFIFSNSLDHSYDPVYCLSQWMKCIKDDGIIYLQWDNGYTNKKLDGTYVKNIKSANASTGAGADCFLATIDGYQQIVEDAGNGEWVMEFPEELDFKNENNGKYFIIRRKNES